MTTPATPPELQLQRHNFVGIIEWSRPPHNFFDLALITQIADAIEQLEGEGCRALVLCSQGASFCAGANFGNAKSGGGSLEAGSINPVYLQALRIFNNHIPIIAAVHGAAVGGGLGLAVAADFRVACPEARFSANFTRLGIHPGFGLSVTLPHLLGPQAASLLFYSGRRISVEEAFTIGLVDELVEQASVRERAIALAQEIALSAPLAVTSLRETLRADLRERVAGAIQRESDAQFVHFGTEDFREGVEAMTARRTPLFVGR